ncbi:MAG: mechanosensitive ion channel family protein [Gammaproteobacteria bacterium]|nr:mechanosensitive ion channel family protein [Gammaproteobacteria bacterium]
MESVLNNLTEYLSIEHLQLVIRAVMVLVIAWLIARIVSGALVRLFRKHTDAQGVMLIRTFSKYLIMGLAVVMIIKELGFDIGVLLGAAGILTVAIGFASQTSMSNLISGLFLLGERPFMVGDIIRVGSVIGEVLSIDLLSVKLRTFDNLFARIPNEALIKKDVINYSRFSIRRLDMELRVPLDFDLEQIQQILSEVADHNPLCLQEPEVFCMVRGFGESWIELIYGVWTLQDNYIELKNCIYKEVLEAFKEHGIPYPIPQQTLHYAGSNNPVSRFGE